MASATGHTRLDLAPGRHAVVVTDDRWEPPAPPAEWDGSIPVLSSAVLTVNPPDGASPTRGDGGPIQMAGFIAALAVHAAAVYLVVAGTIESRRRLVEAPIEAQAAPSARRDRSPIAIPAAMVAVVMTLVVGALAVMAIDLAHNPF